MEKAELTYASWIVLSRFFFRFLFWPLPLPFRDFLQKKEDKHAETCLRDWGVNWCAEILVNRWSPKTTLIDYYFSSPNQKSQGVTLLTQDTCLIWSLLVIRTVSSYYEKGVSSWVSYVMSKMIVCKLFPFHWSIQKLHQNATTWTSCCTFKMNVLMKKKMKWKCVLICKVLQPHPL